MIHKLVEPSTHSFLQVPEVGHDPSIIKLRGRDGDLDEPGVAVEVPALGARATELRVPVRRLDIVPDLDPVLSHADPAFPCGPHHGNGMRDAEYSVSSLA